MRMSEFLHEDMILSELHATDKEGVLREMAHHLCAVAPGMADAEDRVVRALIERERLGSTGVGEGVAIPHAKVQGIARLVAVFGRSSAGVAFDAIDQHPVTLVVLLLVPENSAGLHLKALARISRLLKNSAFRDDLLKVDTQSGLYRAFLDEDARC
ncbi:MAG: PTS sugar transporter subunit IIA [Clostridia bacterium]|nr:PTS sugar transporter subunit IIA [Deltaproteobacteria bacterium]